MFLSTHHVRYYQVTSGPLAKNQVFRGIALRSEQVITTDTSGYVTFYAQGNARVRRSGMLFGISSEKSEAARRAMSADAKRSVRAAIEDFTMNYNGVRYRDVYDLKYDITGMIVSDIPAQAGSLQQTAGPGGTYTAGNETITASPRDGIVVYSLDGFEGMTADQVRPEDFDESGYHLTELRTSERVNAGDPVLKIVDSEAWSLVIPLTSLQIVRLDGLSDIRVKFLKDGATQMASMTIMTMQDNTYYCRLDFREGMIRYADDRFLDVELVTNTRTGLKVPISSIVSKDFFTIPEAYATEGGEAGSEVGFLREIPSADGTVSTQFVTTTLYEHRDGKYYIDDTDFSAGDVIVRKESDGDRYQIGATDSLEGVYCTNKGYAVFRKIVILDKNEEYCIVESGTDYGI